MDQFDRMARLDELRAQVRDGQWQEGVASANALLEQHGPQREVYLLRSQCFSALGLGSLAEQDRESAERLTEPSPGRAEPPPPTPTTPAAAPGLAWQPAAEGGTAPPGPEPAMGAEAAAGGVPTGMALWYDMAPPGRQSRWKTGFRWLLGLPHVLIVGGPGVGLGANSSDGVLGSVASLVAVFAWFTILFTGRYPRGLWGLGHLYLSWRARALAYLLLLREEYPPFGEGEYPALFQMEYQERHSRWTTFFRLILAIPNVLVFALASIAWAFLMFFSWVATLFAGRHPEGLWRFHVGMVRWSLCLQAYLLLLRDEYPPFGFAGPIGVARPPAGPAEPVGSPAGPAPSTA